MFSLGLWENIRGRKIKSTTIKKIYEKIITQYCHSSHELHMNRYGGNILFCVTMYDEIFRGKLNVKQRIILYKFSATKKTKIYCELNPIDHNLVTQHVSNEMVTLTKNKLRSAIATFAVRPV